MKEILAATVCQSSLEMATTVQVCVCRRTDHLRDSIYYRSCVSECDMW